MKNVILEIEENLKLNETVYLMKLKGDLSSVENPGEFVEILLPKFYLRRPISIFDYSKDSLSLLYKVLGQGTLDMTSFQKGMKLDVLVNLGNGFDTSISKKPLLIGGGIGIAPLYALAKEFNSFNIRPTIVLGFKNHSEVILEKEFQEVGDTFITTDDGSCGLTGNCITFMELNKIDFDYYYACGPLIMLKNLAKDYKFGFLSLEARMGCGFGACMGCSIKTTEGYKRVCKEGPVFKADEVIF